MKRAATQSSDGPGRNPRRRGLALLVGVAVLIMVPVLVSQATAALSLADPPTFNTSLDENGADDQPGQKDLSLQGVGSKGPGDLWTTWQWDVTSLSGGNTGDACSLFDTNMDSKVNFAVCVTIGGKPANQLVGSPRVYTCGDGKVDRCTSTYAEVPAADVNTACGTDLNADDPFHAGEKDTRAICHIDLDDVGGVGTASLVNTCSYPSQQPTSAPSDCVLVPRDAFLKITKVADPSDAGSFPFRLGLTTDATIPVVFTAAGSQSSDFIAIRSDRAYKLKEDTPTGWDLLSASCTGATGTGSSNGTKTGDTISGIDASPDNQVICTYTNKRQTANVKVLKTDDLGRDLDGATFELFTDNAPKGVSPGVEDIGTAQDPISSVGSCTTTAAGNCTISNIALGDYWLIETGVPAGHTGADPQTVSLTTGGSTVEKTYINARQSGGVTIVKRDDGANLLDGVKFTLQGTSTFGDTVDRSCTTVLGTCTISNVPLGTYTLDEDVTTIQAGFTKDPTLPKQITISSLGQDVPVSVVNPRSHRVITIVCHEGTIALDATDVTKDGGPTKTSISGVPAALAAKNVTAADLCAIGGATFGDLAHVDTDFTVELAE
jgi:hypothetical protein